MKHLFGRILRGAFQWHTARRKATAGVRPGIGFGTASPASLRTGGGLSQRAACLALAIGVLLVCGCGTTSSASEIQRKKTNYSRDFTGVWGEGGQCKYGGDFVFADSFIERASEDICYIKSINERVADIEVTAICWHEYKQVGSPTYRLRLTPEGRLVINDRDANAYHKCGPVPQELTDFYIKKKDQ